MKQNSYTATITSLQRDIDEGKILNNVHTYCTKVYVQLDFLFSSNTAVTVQNQGSCAYFGNKNKGFVKPF